MVRESAVLWWYRGLTPQYGQAVLDLHSWAYGMWLWNLCNTSVLCCQGHHPNGDVSHIPDVMVLSHGIITSQGIGICLCSAAKVTVVMVMSASNLDVMSLSIASSYAGWAHQQGSLGNQLPCATNDSALPDQINDGYMLQSGVGMSNELSSSAVK